ncbi:MAG: OsmC family peroxiredoxin [Candidatus Dormibacteria bacterium]
MPTRTARASWAPGEHGGGGEIRSNGGGLSAEYSFGSRFEDAPGTNPEELLGAAHASCFNIALSRALAGEGHEPTRLETAAEVSLEKQPEGFRITSIRLLTVGEVSGLSEEEFGQHAHKAKLNCPISKALSGTDIFLEAKLL